MKSLPRHFPNPLHAMQRYLDSIEIHNSQTATWICTLIPACCPFQRTLRIGQYQIAVPPLCQLNPFYTQLINLRLRALTYLAQQENQNPPSIF